MAVKYGPVVSSCTILDMAGSMCDCGLKQVCERLLYGGLQWTTCQLIFYLTPSHIKSEVWPCGLLHQKYSQQMKCSKCFTSVYRPVHTLLESFPLKSNDHVCEEAQERCYMRTVIWRKNLKNETPIGHSRFREVLLGWDNFSLCSVEQSNLLVNQQNQEK